MKAHNSLPDRGGFTPFQLLLGHEPEQPDGEALDPEREGSVLTSYMAEQLGATSAAALESSAGVLMWTGLEWLNWYPLKVGRRARAGLDLQWCSVRTSTRKWRPSQGSRLDCLSGQIVASGTRTLQTTLKQ